MMARRLLMLTVVVAVAAVVHVATVLAVPRLVMHLVTERMAAIAAVNAPLHLKPAGASDRAVPLPSPDLLYSSCVLDAGDGPVEVSVTPGAAYLSLAVFDMRSDNIFVTNDQAGVGQPIKLLVTAPGESVHAPAGVRVVRLSSNRGLLLLRGLAATPELARISDQARHTLSCRAA